MGYALDPKKLQSGREVCPECGRKGLGYAPHPHALGWKDHSSVRCRYCKARFRRDASVNAPHQ